MVFDKMSLGINKQWPLDIKQHPFIIEYHIRFQMANIWFSQCKHIV